MMSYGYVFAMAKARQYPLALWYRLRPRLPRKSVEPNVTLKALSVNRDRLPSLYPGTFSRSNPL